MCDDADDDDHRDDAEAGESYLGTEDPRAKGNAIRSRVCSSNPVEIYVSRIMKTKVGAELESPLISPNGGRDELGMNLCTRI